MKSRHRFPRSMRGLKRTVKELRASQMTDGFEKPKTSARIDR
jgi:hypothetical protein